MTAHKHADLMLQYAQETDQLRKAAEQVLIADEAQHHTPAPPELEAAVNAALAQPAEVEPAAWLFQHEETGNTECVDVQQVEWGFEKNNPRWQKIRPLFTRPAPAREWVGLSDEEIEALAKPFVCLVGGRWDYEDAIPDTGGIEGFANAISDALKAKNGGAA